MRTERGSGKHVHWVNGTGTAVVSGQLVLVGTNLVGVASVDIAAAGAGDVMVAGEHEVLKTVAEGWAAGDVLYFVTATAMLSNVAGNAVAGLASKAAINGATTGLVILTKGQLAAPGGAAVTTASLANAVADQIASLTVTAGAEGAHARTITVQAKDAQGNNLAARVLLDLLVNATSQDTAPTATATDTFAGPTAGIIVQTVTAKAAYRVQTDNTGKYVFVLTHNDAGSNRFIQAACQGLVATSGAIAFDAV